MLINCLIFLSPFVDLYKDFHVNSFFYFTARPWNFVSIQYFSLIYDQDNFKSRINRHLLTVGSF